MGAHAVKAADLGQLQQAIIDARGKRRPTVIVIDTTARDFPGTGIETSAGPHGHFWDVAVPEVGDHDNLRDAYARYIANAAKARLVN